MVSKKIADFGASDPLGARLWLGILELAHHVLKTKIILPRESSPGFEFDVKYEPILNALMACRQAKINVIQLTNDHKQKVLQNKIVRFHPGHYEVLETIDAPVKENLTSFITNGVMAVKGIQNVLSLFNLDIGCLFQKQDKFYDGVNDLYASGRHFLASYLKQVRNFWCEKFITRRNELEHKGWIIPEFTYKKLALDKIEPIEPVIDELSVTDYSIIMLNRIYGFIENILCHGIRQKIDQHEALVEIPAAERNPAVPIRFKIVPKSEAVMEWDIRYSEDDFCCD
jgi:hypothetical protein